LYADNQGKTVRIVAGFFFSASPHRGRAERAWRVSPETIAWDNAITPACRQAGLLLVLEILPF